MNLSKLKRWFVGTPIATAQAHHERLGPVTGLAVFASDNLSSVAYATEEILRVLLLAGVGALAFSVPIGLCIGAVIGIVILSYRQNIAAYPQGASDYIVAKDNLGVFPGLTAGAALLIDYTLTVAVSVSAGSRRAHLRLPGALPVPRRARRRPRGARRGGEPAGHPRVRAGVRGVELPVHRRLCRC